MRFDSHFPFGVCPMQSDAQKEEFTAFRISGTLGRTSTAFLSGRSGTSVRCEVALLTLDGEGILQLEVRTKFGGDAIPIEEHLNRTLTWSVLEGPKELDVARLRVALTAGGELFELMRRVAEGHGEEWDGSNVVGTLTGDADEARDAIQQAFENEAFASDMHVMDARDFYVDPNSLNIRADSTDAELATLAEADEATAASDGLLLVDALDVLTEFREELRERALDDE